MMLWRTRIQRRRGGVGLLILALLLLRVLPGHLHFHHDGAAAAAVHGEHQVHLHAPAIDLADHHDGATHVVEFESLALTPAAADGGLPLPPFAAAILLSMLALLPRSQPLCARRPPVLHPPDPDRLHPPLRAPPR